MLKCVEYVFKMKAQVPTYEWPRYSQRFHGQHGLHLCPSGQFAIIKDGFAPSSLQCAGMSMAN